MFKNKVTLCPESLGRVERAARGEGKRGSQRERERERAGERLKERDAEEGRERLRLSEREGERESDAFCSADQGLR